MNLDEDFIRRCIVLSQKAVEKGDSPFGALIVRKNKILVESENRMHQDNDITNHAEILVMRRAQKLLKTSDLSDCTLYSNCEPCPMCSFMAREAKFKKIVFSVRSLWMGGYTKWAILQDKKLGECKPYFDKPPVIIQGVLVDEAIKVFRKFGWNEAYI